MKKPYSECRYHWDNDQVLADGTGRPCCWFDYDVGNLKENTFEEVWNGSKMQDLRQSILNNEIHSQCSGKPCPFDTGDKFDQ